MLVQLGGTGVPPISIPICSRLGRLLAPNDMMAAAQCPLLGEERKTYAQLEVFRF
jgi:hypothetical protein